MIVGVTGGIGAGKTTVCSLFRSFGVPFISADELAHQLLDNDPVVFKAITKKFGPTILSLATTINRHKLQEIIFNSTKDKLWLEKLLHPLIKQAIMSRAQAVEFPYCIVEIPLLIEAEMENSVDRILTVDAPENLQLARAMQRDNSSKDTVQSIMAQQVTRKIRLAKSHDIIENVADLEALKKLVIYHHNYYLSLATHEKH